ncbi:hypothetical protein DVS77_04215 [Mycolicibacterium moriokaense]|nr:hypothetical protein DVS77_04215 [Mycolicibacterium moriokaense]
MASKARLSTAFKARLSLLCTMPLLVVGAAACEGSSTASESAPSSAEASTSQPDGSKVSANSASKAEIESALASADVSNAGRWAEEVVEYRPYPDDDPNLTKLRDNLAKYNPGEETVDKIVSALTP